MLLSGDTQQETQVVEINTQGTKKVLRIAERAPGLGVIFRGDNWHSFWQGVFFPPTEE
jgi:hypothetical protein